MLEGQTIGIVPPGTDAQGRPHYARLYSVASPRDGERPRYNNIALTVKRVTEDHAGQPVRGVASNFLCDLAKGDTVNVIGPFGTSFLMPNHPGSSLLMICTGTGSAPMRAMTEHRRRRIGSGDGGELMLFFGARAPEELPYFGPLMKLPRDFIDINLAFSRVPGQPKHYVQDLIRARGDDVVRHLTNDQCYRVRMRPEGHGRRRHRSVPRHLPSARPRLGRAAAGPARSRDAIISRPTDAPSFGHDASPNSPQDASSSAVPPR